MARWRVLCCVLSMVAVARAETLTAERDASINQLFDANQAHELSRTLPADRVVKFRVRLPDTKERCGVVVFVKPTAAGTPPADWLEPLDRHHLAWISADDYGNDKPTAQRVLVAMMALKVAQQSINLDSDRAYIAGMSGGGRVASRIITQFPTRFAGAIFIVGADFWLPEEPGLALAQTRGYVFITGSQDFNRREMHHVFERYRQAGMRRAWLMDLPDMGHEYPRAGVLERALDYLLTP